MATEFTSVSIDVSKRSLDVCLLKEGARPLYTKVKNDAQGWLELYLWALKDAQGTPVRFCMESTGGYEFGLAVFLAERGAYVSVENPRSIAHFAGASNVQNKTDRSDALLVARYQLAMKPRAWDLADPVIRQLSQLTRYRESLIEALGVVRNHLEHRADLPQIQVRQLEARGEFLRGQLKEIGKELERLVKSSDTVKKKVETLQGIPGVGFLSAVTILCEMPDIARFDCAQKWASMAGLFPKQRQSGQWKGKTFMSKSGNAHVRRTLYMGATKATQLHPAIKDLSQRLKARGKTPMQARIACMRKMLLIAYGVLKAVQKGKTPLYGIQPEIPTQTEENT